MIRKRTLFTLALSIGSLLLVSVNWRLSLAFATAAIALAVVNPWRD